MEKQNIILTDCEEEEIKDFAKGIEEIIGKKFEVKSKICNGKRNLINNIKRYFIYVFYPLKFVIKRKKYDYIIGWQQFFTLFYAFYCNLFKLKKKNIVVVCNFTYKSKKWLIGKIYKHIMKYCINNIYLDYIHVPSKEYAEICSKEFKIDINKFIITTFGLNDNYNQWKDSKVEYSNYTLAIGRSNRDYDFLIDSWNLMPKKEKLLIISDEYKSKRKLPDNIILRNNITGDQQFPYITNCKLMIIPIKDGNICSGDTVLLKAMSYYKPIIITKPSTLAEMYIIDNKNGICLEKEKKSFYKETLSLLNNQEKMKQLAEEARISFVNKFSRYNMGKKIGEKIRI